MEEVSGLTRAHLIDLFPLGLLSFKAERILSNAVIRV